MTESECSGDIAGCVSPIVPEEDRPDVVPDEDRKAKAVKGGDVVPGQGKAVKGSESTRKGSPPDVPKTAKWVGGGLGADVPLVAGKEGVRSLKPSTGRHPPDLADGRQHGLRKGTVLEQESLSFLAVLLSEAARPAAPMKPRRA